MAAGTRSAFGRTATTVASDTANAEPGMLQAGQRRCQQAGVANVRWVQGVAEDIAALNLGSWRAVTFGQSFHRVRRLEDARTSVNALHR
jgi:ubiquinone/menaquinone biosynthesis C-methylase UbiE